MFDTFEGLPCSDPGKGDKHRVGDFKGPTPESAEKVVGYERASFHVGELPGTFAGLEGSAVAFCHVDVDVYWSVRACCEFVWPRLMVGGVMVFDDYDASSCPGARLAVDEYFGGRGAWPLVVKSRVLGSAVVFKSR